MRVVFDTSVLVAAAHSRREAGYGLVSSVPSSRFEICLSVPLYTECQDVLTRSEHWPPGLSAYDALAALRALAARAHLQEIYYLWRPFLGDPDDDMVLELAFAADCRYIVTHNSKDFAGAPQLGIEILFPLVTKLPSVVFSIGTATGLGHEGKSAKSNGCKPRWKALHRNQRCGPTSGHSDRGGAARPHHGGLKSGALFDCVPARLRPPGTPLRMTGDGSAPLKPPPEAEMTNAE